MLQLTKTISSNETTPRNVTTRRVVGSENTLVRETSSWGGTIGLDIREVGSISSSTG